jgi:hypothetical protein
MSHVARQSHSPVADAEFFGILSLTSSLRISESDQSQIFTTDVERGGPPTQDVLVQTERKLRREFDGTQPCGTPNRYLLRAPGEIGVAPTLSMRNYDCSHTNDH